MNETAIKAGAPPLAANIVTPAPRPRPADPIWLRAVKVAASLRITVVLFALSIFLVFAGTLAQVDNGIWTVVNQYFRSALVWVPVQIFFPTIEGYDIWGQFPFPGGWLLGGLLLVNLLAAHAIRFRINWKRSGILLIHSGLIVMMMSELVTGLFAVESHMTLADGERSNFIDVTQELELAITDPADPKVENAVVIPQALLRNEGRITHELLPFDLVVDHYMVNSAVVRADGSRRNPATAGDGLDWLAIPRSEVAGTGEQTMDIASAYVTVKQKGTDKALGTYLVSMKFYGNFFQRVYPNRPQVVTVAGKTYELMLRNKRVYQPFAVELVEFKHDVYVGTSTAKNFSSQIRLLAPGRGEDRQVNISMNDPLRYQGETFYQSGFLPGDTGTVLQVVRNPGWLMPYISCAMVAIGMIIHFGLHLRSFLQKRMAL